MDESCIPGKRNLIELCADQVSHSGKAGAVQARPFCRIWNLLLMMCKAIFMAQSH